MTRVLHVLFYRIPSMTRKKRRTAVKSAIPRPTKKEGQIVGHNKDMTKIHEKSSSSHHRESSTGQFVTGRVERDSTGKEYFHIDLSRI